MTDDKPYKDSEEREVDLNSDMDRLNEYSRRYEYQGDDDTPHGDDNKNDEKWLDLDSWNK